MKIDWQDLNDLLEPLQTHQVRLIRAVQSQSDALSRLAAVASRCLALLPPGEAAALRAAVRDAVNAVENGSEAVLDVSEDAVKLAQFCQLIMFERSML